MIDLCDSMSSSSDDEEESGCHNLSRRGALLLPCQQQRNSRKRGHYYSPDVLSVSSSPSLSPGKHIMGKSNREKKQEQLDRAKQWSDDRKKKRAPSNNNAGVVNLSSPRGSSVAAAAAGLESPTNSPHRKMSSREKQDARDRAKIWSDDRKKAANNNSSPHRVTLLDSDSDDDSDGEDMLTQFREMRARQERNRQIRERDTSRVTRTDSDDPSLAHQVQSSARTHGRHGRRNRGLDSSNAGSIIRTDSNNDPLDEMNTQTQLRGRRIRRTNSNSESQQQHHQSQSNGFATFDAPGDTQMQSRGRRMRQTGTNIRMSSSDVEPQTTTTHAASSAAARGMTSAASRSRGSQRGGNQQQSQQWQCPRCTLLNSDHASRCGACAHNNPSQPQNNNDSMSSTEGIRRMMSGNGYPSANPYSSAGLSDMLVDFSRRNYSSEMSEIARAYRIAAGGGGGGGRRSGYNPFHYALHSTFGAPRDSIDNMSYEQLLERFGDGSENRGASSSTIASLPVNVVGNPESELPEDKRQCSICLEDFSRGEERTTLLCLHGFHTSCVNRWLQSNGTCPVCKTSVNSN